MRRLLLFVSTALVLVGLGYYGLAIYPTRHFRTELDAAIAKLPAGYSAKVGSVRYSLSKHRAELKNVAIRTKSGDGVEMDEAVIDDPAFDAADAWARAAATPATLKPEQVMALARHAELRGVRAQQGASTGSFGFVSLEAPRLYPWAILHPGAPSLGEFSNQIAALHRAEVELRDIPDDEDTGSGDALDVIGTRMAAAAAPLLRSEAALLLAVGFNALDIKDASVATPVPGRDAPSRIAFASAETRNYDRGEQGASVVEKLVEDLGPNGTLTVERVSQAKLDSRAMLMRLIDGAPLTMQVLDGLRIQGLSMDEMSRTQGARTHHIRNVSLDELAFDHGFLTSASFAISGLAITTAGLPKGDGRKLMRQFGLTTLTIGAGGAFHWDQTTRTATLRQLGLKIDELGSFDLSVDLTDVGPGSAPNSKGWGFAGATIRYVDGSLLDRLVGAKSARVRAHAADKRQDLADMLLEELPPPGTSRTMDDLGKAISAFAADPKSLTITSKPATPLPVAAIILLGASNLQELLPRLGISATVNQ